MLHLLKHNAHIDGLNVRIENHGKDRELGVDIKLSFTGSNNLLNGIDASLRESLYRAPERGDQTDFVDNQAANENGVADGLVSVKHPYAGPTTISTKFEAYEATIRGPLKRSKSIELADVTVKGISLQPLDGGSVKILLSVQAKIEPKDGAVLLELFKLGDVRVSLVPPDVQHEQSDEGEEEEDEEGDADGTPRADSPQGDILDSQDAEDARARAANDDAGNDPGMPHAA